MQTSSQPSIHFFHTIPHFPTFSTPPHTSLTPPLIYLKLKKIKGPKTHSLFTSLSLHFTSLSLPQLTLVESYTPYLRYRRLTLVESYTPYLRYRRLTFVESYTPYLRYRPLLSVLMDEVK